MDEMKLVLNLRSVAKEDESIARKHDRFVKAIVDLGSPWNMAGATQAPDPGSGLSARLSARKCFGYGFGGDLTYQYRRPFGDVASADDYLWLEFNPSKIDYEQFIARIVPTYVRAFDAYFAELKSIDSVDLDFREQQADQQDERGSVLRLAPVTYLSALLCARAFNKGKSDVAQLLREHVESIDELEDGLYIVVTSATLPTEKAREIGGELVRRLKAA